MTMKLANGYGEFRKMWRGYIEELSQYNPKIKYDEQAVYEMFYEPIYTNYFLLNDEHMVVGFVCIANDTPAKQIFIAETYVKREFRRKGVATQAVNELKRIYQGNICFDVLKKNKPAKEFWDKQFISGYKDRSDEFKSHDRHCDFYFYEKLV